MLSRCRGNNNFIDFNDKPGILKIDVESYPDEERGVIKKWEYNFDNTEAGFDIGSLTELFSKLNQKCIDEQQKYKRSLVIWTDNLKKIEGFFSKYITEDFKGIYLGMDHLEFRDIHTWKKNISDNIYEWKSFVEELYKNVFIPKKYMYITPNQIVRKEIQHSDTSLAKEIYPESYNEVEFMRQALFGGLCYCPYPGLTIEEPMLALDIRSAYIFDMICCKHIVTRPNEVNPEHWEYYLSSDTKTSLGYYKIKFANWSNRTQCFKDEFGHRLPKGEQTQTFVMNNIDLKFFLSLVTVLKVECLYLEEYTLGYLPKDLINILIKNYELKYQIDETIYPELYKLQKVKLNGIFGDSIRKTDKEDFWKDKKNAYMFPGWGIWTSSYCKKYLYELASKIDGWYYSDTDSIYCKDTPENRQAMKEFNEKIQDMILDFCNNHDIDSSKLQGLGQFKIEAEIIKFKALACKEYMYTTKDGKFIVKAAGCDKQSQVLDNSLYEKDKIPVGKRTFWDINNDSYYEYDLWNEDAEAMIEMAMLLENI